MRISRTREYKDLTDYEKVMKLMKDYQISMRKACGIVGVTPQSIIRGKKAVAENRCVGIPGRPTLLNAVGEAELVKCIEDADDKKEALSFKKVKEKVCCTFMNYISVL